MKPKPLHLLIAAAGLLAASVSALPRVGALERGPKQEEPTVEWREVFSEDGTIRRVRLRHRVPDEPAVITEAAEVIPIEVNGPSESQFDLVFVGDGYTSSQMGLYGDQVRSKFNEIMALEPFQSHRSQFNVWQVNVVSSQSGVDNDPTRGVQRATALDMYFWCGGIERLLCVNSTKANQYAASAPDAEQVIALGNSTKYGGAGGGIATASGGHGTSGQIAIHELGHSIGGLADEYDYGAGDCYPYGEPRAPNVSRYSASQMRAYQLKWYRNLGQTTPDGGVIDTYVGASYYKRCIYRPSQNSIMRSLGRQFNLPSRDAMISGFYRER